MRSVTAMQRVDVHRDVAGIVLAGLDHRAVPGHARHSRTGTHQRHREQMQQHRQSGYPDRGTTGTRHGKRISSSRTKTQQASGAVAG